MITGSGSKREKKKNEWRQRSLIQVKKTKWGESIVWIAANNNRVSGPSWRDGLQSKQ